MNEVENIHNLLGPYLKEKNFILEVAANSQNLDTLLLCCKENLGYSLLSDIVCKELEDSSFSLKYILKKPSSVYIIQVTLVIKSTDIVSSVAQFWEHSKVYEKEIFEMFGVKFDYEIKRYLFDENLIGHPLRKSFEGFKVTEPIKDVKNNSEFDICIKPKFPLSEQDLRIFLNLNNDLVKKTKLDLGYMHFGFEKFCQNKSITNITQHLGLLSSSNSGMYQIAYVDMLERFSNIKIPDKAMGIRMILNELFRINDHLFEVLKISYQCQYEDLVGHLYLLLSKTKVQIDRLMGERNRSYYIVYGGVRSDLPMGWASECIEFLSMLEKELLNEYRFVSNNSFCFDRLQCGKVTRENAVDWGVTGPTLRASGVNFDLRKREPKYFYNSVSFEVPLGINGYVYDRLLVYIEEIFQSVQILFQVLDNIPTGKVMAQELNSVYDYKDRLNNDEYSYTGIQIKPLLNIENELLSNQWELSNGILNLHLDAKDLIVDNLKIASPSANAIALFENIITDKKLEDVELIWESLNIKLSEAEK